MGFPVGIAFPGFQILHNPLSSAYAPAESYPSSLQFSRKRVRYDRPGGVHHKRNPISGQYPRLGHREGQEAASATGRRLTNGYFYFNSGIDLLDSTPWK